MDSPVTEKMCKERHLNLEEKVDSIKEEVMKIRILWTGNGRVGAGYKINTMWEVYNDDKKRNRDLWTSSIRTIMIILLTFIAVKVGLK